MSQHTESLLNPMTGLSVEVRASISSRLCRKPKPIRASWEIKLRSRWMKTLISSKTKMNQSITRIYSRRRKPIVSPYNNLKTCRASEKKAHRQGMYRLVSLAPWWSRKKTFIEFSRKKVRITLYCSYFIGQYYLPPYENCPLDFLKDVLAGRKKVINLLLITSIASPKQTGENHLGTPPRRIYSEAPLRASDTRPVD